MKIICMIAFIKVSVMSVAHMIKVTNPGLKFQLGIAGIGHNVECRLSNLIPTDYLIKSVILKTFCEMQFHKQRE